MKRATILLKKPCKSINLLMKNSDFMLNNSFYIIKEAQNSIIRYHYVSAVLANY